MPNPVPAAPPRPARDSRVRRATLVLALLVTLVTVVQARHRAGKGRYAMLEWRPAQEALAAGEPIYGVAREGVGEEGYPTLPLTLLLQRPFHALPDRGAAVLWALLLSACAWGVVLGAMHLATGRPAAYPPWAGLALLLLCLRVLSSDVQHGNLNLLVAAPVVLGFLSWERRAFGVAGAAFGLATVLKVTPALTLLWVLRRGGLRAPGLRGLAGFGLGLAAGVLLPALVLGWERNLDLLHAWVEQMLLPYLRGRELGLMQTEHLNQSLLGTLARWLTDCVAVDVRPGGVPATSVNLLALSPDAFRWLHRGVCALLLAGVLVRCGREPGPAGAPEDPLPRGARILGEAALVVLAMLLLSERSWKHHFVLLPLPLALLLPLALARGPAFPGRLAARLGALAALLGVALTGEALLGARGSDLAEAYGSFTAAALVLLAGVARVLGPRPRIRPDWGNGAGEAPSQGLSWWARTPEESTGTP